MSVAAMSLRLHQEVAPSLVRCSTCAEEVNMDTLAEHVCTPSSLVTGTSITAEPSEMSESQPLQPPRRGASLFKRTRPSLPRLDSAVSGRSGLDLKEAANIAHDLGLPSPLSAGSGRRTPSSRKSSKSRGASGPRSPELPISQDCAFPPFPTNKPKRAQTDNSVASRQARSASRSASRARTHGISASNSTTSSTRSTSSNGMVKRRTSERSLNQHSRQGTIEESRSITSTAPSSPHLTADGIRLENKDSSNIPSLSLQETYPSDSGSDTLTSASTSASPATPLWPLTANHSTPRIANYVPTLLGQESDPTHTQDLKQESQTDVPLHHRVDSAVTFDKLFPSRQLPRTSSENNMGVREPSYKAKRPAPLSQARSNFNEEQSMPSNTRSPLTGGLGRTFTNLFSRRRSQSLNSKKLPKASLNDLRLQALAAEPSSIPRSATNSSNQSKTIDGDYFGSQHASSEAEISYEDKTDTTVVPTMRAYPEVLAEERSTHEDRKDESRESEPSGFVFSFTDHQKPEANDKGNITDIEPVNQIRTTVLDLGDKISMADSGRVSIDSASSYGSIGFSDRTVSSRSSNPPSLDMRSKIAAALDPDNDVDAPVETAAPLSVQINEQVPDSPTDPLYQQGHLSPVPETQTIRWPSLTENIPLPDEHLTVSPRVEPPQEISLHLPAVRRASTPGGIKGICRGCSQTILAGQKSVSSKDGRLTGRYHKECFTCRTCREPFATADFYVHDDQPYCSHHYHVVNNTLCTACGIGIEGQFLQTFDTTGTESKKFHPKCLTCFTCKMQLGDDYFEFHDRIYCERDAFRAASGPKSPYDNAPSRPSPLVREYINSEQPGLKGRFPERRTTKLLMT